MKDRHLSYPDMGDNEVLNETLHNPFKEGKYYIADVRQVEQLLNTDHIDRYEYTMDQNMANSQSLISLHDIDNSMWKRSQLSSYFHNNTNNKVMPMNIPDQYDSKKHSNEGININNLKNVTSRTTYKDDMDKLDRGRETKEDINNNSRIGDKNGNNNNQ